MDRTIVAADLVVGSQTRVVLSGEGILGHDRVVSRQGHERESIFPRGLSIVVFTSDWLFATARQRKLELTTQLQTYGFTLFWHRFPGSPGKFNDSRDQGDAGTCEEHDKDSSYVGQAQGAGSLGCARFFLGTLLHDMSFLPPTLLQHVKSSSLLQLQDRLREHGPIR